MADYTIDDGEHGAYEKTLVAATVDTVTFTDVDSHLMIEIEIYSDGVDSIFVRTDGQDPAVGDSAAWYVPAVPSIRELILSPGDIEVKLISSGTPTYSVSRR